MACTNPVRLQKDFSISSLKATEPRKGGTELKVPVAQCKGIQDTFGFWIPRRGFQIPGTRFWILSQWDLDSGFFELYSGFQSPGFQIPVAKISRIPESSFSLHEAIPEFLIFVEWCEVQCICTYISWQVLIKTFLLHCPQQVQLFSLDARKTEQKSKLLDRLGLRRGEIKSDKRRRWNFSGIRTHIIDVVYKNSKWVKEAMTSWPWNKLGPNSCKTREPSHFTLRHDFVADVLVGARLDPCLR